ncbi:MAG: NAD-dependent epimerase/dehydratase family protein [Candidatus Margulisbacteria bacterium]|nr:NAD-dependent epimerase/dehydratase family protein [Candidatus Margulisiibacteriota bacterium]MBU1617772.1 NAD-dependent epimerase/dehydratase family protein [Candidatus Margulisiibacteriota bacterium]MBU1867831.1 NAD-dependent epimerase/dehydratase family protein [Candidatus Margulisiibacteriota bacterium]
MRILVTGGAGFIGSNIVDCYLDAGHEVAVLDNISTGKKENLNPKAVFFQNDLRDQALSGIIADFKPELINHLAAQIDVRKSVTDPIFNAEINELGTLNLLNAARDAKVGKIIFSSTGGALYGEVKEPNGAAEDHPMEPISPYAITKRSVEMYLHAYSQLYGLKYTVLRYGNVYGPRQDPLGEAGVIAIFCGKIKKKEVPTIYGDGEQLRDYIYVGEVARANLIALTKGDNRLFNIGTGVGTSVNQLYGILKEQFKFDQAAVYAPPRAGELFRSVLDCRLAKKELNWQAACDIKEGLKRTVAWYYA